jgi:hypothetical protein
MALVASIDVGDPLSLLADSAAQVAVDFTHRMPSWATSSAA